MARAQWWMRALRAIRWAKAWKSTVPQRTSPTGLNAYAGGKFGLGRRQPSLRANPTNGSRETHTDGDPTGTSWVHVPIPVADRSLTFDDTRLLGPLLGSSAVRMTRQFCRNVVMQICRTLAI